MIEVNSPDWVDLIFLRLLKIYSVLKQLEELQKNFQEQQKQRLAEI